MGDCTEYTEAANWSPQAVVDFRVNTMDLDEIGIPAQQAINAIILAADKWNEQGNGRAFRYVGTTTETSRPFNGACDFSLVRITDIDHVNCSNGDCPLGGASAACYVSGLPTAFLLTLFVRRTAGSAPYDWQVGTDDVDVGQYDMAGVVMHELGHTQGLSHPANGEAAVMAYQTGTVSSSLRELHQWDLACVHEILGRRDDTGYFRYHYSNNSFSSEFSWTGSWSATKGSPGLRYYSTDPYDYDFSSSANRDYGLYWNTGFTTSGAHQLLLDGVVGSTPMTTVWREAMTMQRVFFVDWDDYPASSEFDWDAGHAVRYYRSPNGFSTTYSGTLQYCRNMSPGAGFLGGCDGTGAQAVTTAERTATSWDESIGRTITVWATQDRSRDGIPPGNPGAAVDREVLVAAGRVNEYTLPTPDETEFSSAVAPGVACLPDVPSGWDCLVAYVDEYDPEMRVRTRAIKFTTGSTKYYVNVQSTYVEPGAAVKTASPIALWASDGAYWLAIRTLYANQYVYVYTSTNATTWSYVTSLGYSNVAPAVIPWTRIENAVFLWR